MLENTDTRSCTRSPSPSLTFTDNHPNTVTTAWCNAGVLLLQQVLSVARSRSFLLLLADTLLFGTGTLHLDSRITVLYRAVHHAVLVVQLFYYQG